MFPSCNNNHIDWPPGSTLPSLAQISSLSIQTCPVLWALPIWGHSSALVSQQPCSPRVSPVPLLSQQALAPVRVNCLPEPAPVPGMNIGGTGPKSTEITHRQKTTWLNTRKISKCVPLTCIWHSLVIIFTFPVPTVMSPFPFLILYFLISLSFPKSESQRCHLF